MKSYPPTKLGKLHIRFGFTGETLCGREASSGASVSFLMGHAGTCKRCKASWRKINEPRKP